MRVAVTSSSFSRHPVLRQELLDRYPDSKFNDTGRRLTEDDLMSWLRDRDLVICGLELFTAQVLDAVPSLKVISRVGVGLDNFDAAELKRRNIRIGWKGGVNRQSVAELTICFAIAGLRHVAPLNHDMRTGARPHNRMGRHLGGRVFAIHGCGHVGKEVVRLLQPFNCTVLAHDIREFSDFYEANGVNSVSMEELVERAEVLSLHLPLNDATHGLYGDDVLARMRPDAVLVNTCRGGIVDENALKACLRSGRLAAACFDVFAVEPPIDDELLNAPNFLATPHIGGSAEEALLAMGRAAIEGLSDNFAPEPGEHPFD